MLGLILSINAPQAKAATIRVMKKRARVMQRKAIRKLLFGLLLIAVLSVETLAMTQVYRRVSNALIQQPITVDPAMCFQM